MKIAFLRAAQALGRIGAPNDMQTFKYPVTGHFVWGKNIDLLTLDHDPVEVIYPWFTVPNGNEADVFSSSSGNIGSAIGLGLTLIEEHPDFANNPEFLMMWSSTPFGVILACYHSTVAGNLGDNKWHLSIGPPLHASHVQSYYRERSSRLAMNQPNRSIGFDRTTHTSCEALVNLSGTTHSALATDLRRIRDWFEV